MTHADRDQARDELRGLVAMLRAHIEWHRDSGSLGFPRGGSNAARSTGKASSGALQSGGSSPSSAQRDSRHRGEAQRFALEANEPPLESAALAPPVPDEIALPAARARDEPRASGSDEVALPVARADTSASTASAPASAPAGPSRRVAQVQSAAATSGLDADQLAAVHSRLEVVRERVSVCTACRLHETRTHTVFSRGRGSSGLCFVGEGPGGDEDAQGVPFVGAAGQLLDRMIVAMGMDRDEVYICNIVKCRPPRNRKPAPDEMLACRDYLAQQLAILDPVVIVALGATAVQGLLGTTEGITSMRGRWRLYQGRIAVMPTFHPAYLLRNPAAKRNVWDDLKSVLRQMGRPLPERAR